MEGIHDFWRQYRRQVRAVLGLALVLLATVVGLLAGQLAPYSFSAMSDDLLQAPSLAHLMGTDQLGRDILSRVIWGTRVSLLFALGVAFISLLIGGLLGAIAGYYGGVLDAVLSRTFEVFLTIPRLFLIILIVALFGSNVLFAVLVVGITIWPANARITRAQVLTLKERPFVRAARASGAGDMRLLFRHILPNGLQPVIANSTLQMASAILIEASLSFLGLSDPNLPSWGRMLQEAQSYLQTQWWLAFFPGVAIALLVFGFTLLGDGVNYALDPRSRRQ
ncbi:MAG TPA: ABC transporter permease [Chloroflexi bacterium]|nr:ABC transporter permease [Chloroflexota bacterium]